ncbi:aminopeptidase N [Gluconobacter cerinus]|uniref:M1 family metallopeptidase n=1 Tax=Gluconobacter cerinus TaxID=38307 RepID=UPI002225DE75|nr:M1 family metallopeptidase [Gluconobacter cerinus]MCW2267045.1 aminopeptidase N [Gluconobacter cerinus]
MRRLLAFSTLLAGLPFAMVAHAEGTFSFQQTPGQLPKTVVPASYAIDLETDPEHLTLKGQETIDVTVLTDTQDIVLNQAGLKLSGAVLDGTQHATITQDDAAETATLHFSQPVPKGPHTLSIDYTGPILKTPNGLYINDYTSATGQARRMLVTQFEVADGRRMFPGWDEPAFKASFQLNVTLPFDDVAVSNMPIIGTTQQDTKTKRVSFAPTPRMSSYLLALVAGDMGAVHGEADGTPLSVYALAGLEEQGRYALESAQRILPYYNSYFGVKYPLPKMDMLAIPGNYQAGAMENWGALTYIDNVLLFDPKNSTPKTRELIHEVVAHEMAHQWSGDLVTMGWWNNIWLNEGFASWMEIKVTDKLNPQWDIWPRQHETREETMGIDALSTTHPIQQTIHNVSEANSAFDSISYGKGELVIRMLEGWLGEDKFRDGMRAYMKAHAFGNATSQDLWNALSSTSGEDVAKVARSFTEQPGIPQVNVTSFCQNDQATYTLTQSRFTIHDPQAQPLTWSVPVVAGGPGLPTKTLVLGTEPVTITAPRCDTAFKLNLGESGYYRVSYDKNALGALATSLSKFAPVDRANLLGDQYALFRSGQAKLGSYLDLVDTLTAAHENDIAVLEEIISRLETIDQYEIGNADRDDFQTYARSRLAPVLARLGWDEKPHENVLDTMLRPSVISALGTFNDPQVIAEAKRRFALWKANPASLRPDLVGAVTTIAMKTADGQTYDFMADKVRTTQATELKLRYFAALASATNPDLIRKNVALAYSGAIPNGRIARSLAVIAASSENPDLVWQLVKEHEADIRTHLAPWSQDDFLASIAAHSNNPQVLEALQNDPWSTKTAGAKIATAKAVNTINARQDAIKATQEQIHDWLATHH